MKKHKRVLLLLFFLALALGVALWRRGEVPPKGFAGWNAPVTSMKFEEVEKIVDTVHVAPRQATAAKARVKAKSAEEGHRAGEALEYYRQAIALDPRDVESRLAIARLQLDQWQAPEARPVLDEVLKLEPANTNALLLRAKAKIGAADYDSASADLQKLLKIAPTLEAAYLTGSEMEAQQGHLEPAIDWLKRGVEALPGALRLQEALVEMYERFDRVEDLSAAAEELANRVPSVANRLLARAELAQLGARVATNSSPSAIASLALGNSDPTLLVAAGNALLRSKELETARKLAERATEISPKSAAAWWSEARVDFALDRTNEAQAAFARGYLLDPKIDPKAKYTELRGLGDEFPLPEAYYFLRDLMEDVARRNRQDRWIINVYRARLVMVQKDYDSASAWLEEAVQQRPSAAAYAQLAQLHSYNQRTDLMWENLERALVMDPMFADALALKGRALENLGKFEEARHIYLEALLSDSQHYALTYLKSLYERMNTVDQAPEDFSKLLKRRPAARAELLRLRSTAYWWNGKFYESALDLAEASRLAPNNVRIRGMHAWILQLNGQYGDALREADWALRREPRQLDALVARGYILLDQGKYAEATETAEQVSLLGTSGPQAPQLRGHIFLRQGKFKEAITQLKLAWSLDQVPEIWEMLGQALFLSGNYYEASSKYQRLLHQYGFENRRARLWAINYYLSLMYMGESERAASFMEVFRVGGAQCNWPVGLIRYLNGELPEEIVLAMAARTVVASRQKLSLLPHLAAGHEITAHMVMGHAARIDGDEPTATRHFQWVIDHPHPLFMELYWSAKALLEQGIPGFWNDQQERRKEPIIKGIPAGSLDEQLLAWLPMTDDLLDHGPGSLPVKVTGAVRLTHGVAVFPGDGSHLELPYISLRHQEFAVSMWINVNGGEMMYSLVDQSGMDRCWQHLQIHLRADLQPFLGFYVDDLIAPSSLPSRGGWHHLVFQYVNNRQQIWLNGRLLCERVSPPLEAWDGPTYVGRSPGWQDLHDFEGLMRDFRIYSRPLQSSEISRLADRAALLADLKRRAVNAGLGGDASLTTTRTIIDETANDVRPILSLVGNRLTISGPPVQVYELQATLDLASRWDVIQVLTNTTGHVDFVDEDSFYQGERFFRVRLTDYRPVGGVTNP